MLFFFFFTDTATTEIYTPFLHDALPILLTVRHGGIHLHGGDGYYTDHLLGTASGSYSTRSEEHTSELQSRLHLVCRLLLEKKKKTPSNPLEFFLILVFHFKYILIFSN